MYNVRITGGAFETLRRGMDVKYSRHLIRWGHTYCRLSHLYYITEYYYYSHGLSEHFYGKLIIYIFTLIFRLLICRA